MLAAKGCLSFAAGFPKEPPPPRLTGGRKGISALCLRFSRRGLAACCSLRRTERATRLRRFSVNGFLLWLQMFFFRRFALQRMTALQSPVNGTDAAAEPFPSFPRLCGCNLRHIEPRRDCESRIHSNTNSWCQRNDLASEVCFALRDEWCSGSEQAAGLPATTTHRSFSLQRRLTASFRTLLFSGGGNPGRIGHFEPGRNLCITC